MKDKEDIKDKKEPSTTEDTKQQSSGEADNGVHVTEEYQKKAHELIHKATKHQVHHVRQRLNDREDELRKEEQKNMPATKGPKEFDASESY